MEADIKIGKINYDIFKTLDELDSMTVDELIKYMMQETSYQICINKIQEITNKMNSGNYTIIKRSKKIE